MEVVLVPLPSGEGAETPYTGLLNREETERAGRFLVAHARIAFVVTRGVLRLLLGARTGLDPRALRFVTGPEDKPDLMPVAGAPFVHFNVSHTTGLAAIALSPDVPVGIDVEWCSRSTDIRRLIAMLHPSLALREDAPEAAGWRCWVRTEAALKALGRGIGNAHLLPDLQPMRPGPILVRPTGLAEGSVLHLAELDAGPEHAACLAATAPFADPPTGVWSHREGRVLVRPPGTWAEVPA